MGLAQEHIDDNDLKKLHAEINQIAQQRFYLTTLGIVAFGTICGWAPTLISKTGAFTPQMGTLLLLLVIGVLAVLYTYQFMLLGQMRLLTVYITLRFGSKWESDWNCFRRRFKASRYSWASSSMFSALGTLAQLFVLFLWWFSGKQGQHFGRNLAFQIVLLALYLTGLWWTTKMRHQLFSEDKIKGLWDKVLNEPCG